MRLGDVVRIGDWVGIVSFDTTDPQETPPQAPTLPEELVAGETLRPLLQQAEQVAPATLPVILNGESGTGKEVFARHLHRSSGRRGAFIALNCAAIPETLAESELFGHRRGAFTGALNTRDGAFVLADKGTLFLDEISDLPLSIQAKLLRALETSEVLPLGTSRPVKVDVRVICGCKERLTDLVSLEKFRGDLFARLTGFELTLPPLRVRKDEIIELFLRTYESSCGRRPTLSAEFAEALLVYPWPYNVRELIQTARRVAAINGGAEQLGSDAIPSELKNSTVANSAAAAADLPASSDPIQQLREALQQTGGNVSRAASKLGISRGRAYRLIRSSGDGGVPPTND